MPPTIAAILICRNGVRTLPRLLESIRPHVDEVCVAPSRVEQEEWLGDFAVGESLNRSSFGC